MPGCAIAALNIERCHDRRGPLPPFVLSELDVKLQLRLMLSFDVIRSVHPDGVDSSGSNASSVLLCPPKIPRVACRRARR